MLGWLRLRNRWTDSALSLYRESAEGARQTVFYETFGVPDTLDGRFDMILLHAALLVRRLHREGEAGRALAQEYFDRMFTEMDRAVREMGVGDLSVRRHVRGMMKAFYGRATAYGEALDRKDTALLKQALARNVYGADGGGGGDSGRARRAPEEMALDALARYVILCEDALGWQGRDALLAGRAGFPPAPVAGKGGQGDETQESRADRAGMVLRD